MMQATTAQRQDAEDSIAQALEGLGADAWDARNLARDAVAQASHQGELYYAVVRWSVEDVHKLRCESQDLEWEDFGDKSDWTDEECAEFLASKGGQVADLMIERGWEALETLLDIYVDEQEGRE